MTSVPVPGTAILFVFKTAPFSMAINPRTSLPESVLNVQRGVYRACTEGPDATIDFPTEDGTRRFHVDWGEVLMWTEAPQIEAPSFLES